MLPKQPWDTVLNRVKTVCCGSFRPRLYRVETECWNSFRTLLCRVKLCVEPAFALYHRVRLSAAETALGYCFKQG